MESILLPRISGVGMGMGSKCFDSEMKRAVGIAPLSDSTENIATSSYPNLLSPRAYILNSKCCSDQACAWWKKSSTATAPPGDSRSHTSILGHSAMPTEQSLRKAWPL